VSAKCKCKSFWSLQGDWVWLKKFKEGDFKEVKQSTTNIFTKVLALILSFKTNSLIWAWVTVPIIFIIPRWRTYGMKMSICFWGSSLIVRLLPSSLNTVLGGVYMTSFVMTMSNWTGCLNPLYCWIWSRYWYDIIKMWTSNNLQIIFKSILHFLYNICLCWHYNRMVSVTHPIGHEISSPQRFSSRASEVS